MVKPEAGTLKVQGAEASAQMDVSEMAFPLYCCVPVLGDLLRRHGISRTCATVAECGGPLRSLANFAVYMLLVEAWVYWVHYYLLHRWPWGKKNLKHDLHHAYKHDFEMTTWSGYAFEAIDGASQGLVRVLSLPIADTLCEPFCIALRPRPGSRLADRHAVCCSRSSSCSC